MNHSAQEIEQAFESLPDDLYEAMHQVDVNNVIFSLGRKYGVHIDKQELLKGEILFVLVGLEKASDFPYTIKGKIGLDSEEESKLINEINESVFKTVREKFKEIRESKTSTPEASSEESLLPTDLHQDEHEVLRNSKIEIGTSSGNTNLTPKLGNQTPNSSQSQTSNHSIERASRNNDPYHEPID